MTYFRSYDKPPDKLVCNNTMKSRSIIIEQKKVPFAVLVSDLSVFALNNGPKILY